MRDYLPGEERITSLTIDWYRLPAPDTARVKMYEIVLDSACAAPAQPHRIKIDFVNDITAFLFFKYAPLRLESFRITTTY